MALLRQEAPKTTAPATGVAAPAGTPAPKAGRNLSALKQLGYQKISAMTDDEIKSLGVNSNDIEFISLIGNTFSKVSRKTGDKAALGSESVGLIVKNVSDAPIEYLEFPQKSKKVMDVDFSAPKKAVAQPGEEFQLNWVEAGYLITRDQYAGTFSGGDDANRVIRYAPVSPKEPGRLPTTKFNLAGGSIADYTIEISDDVENRVVKPEFAAKFSIFAEKNVATTRTRSGSPKSKVNLSAVAASTAFDAILGDLNI